VGAGVVRETRAGTAAGSAAADEARWRWLPEWARPRDSERRGRGSLRRVETTLLVLFVLLLAIATVHDVVQQTHVNRRLVADLATWRAYTGHDYHTIAVEQDLKQHTTNDVVCGNTSPGGPKERTQLCLRMGGPTVRGRRRVTGGYYLPAHSEDAPGARYGCFGSALRDKLCLR
jgi:hypothetical protein